MDICVEGLSVMLGERLVLQNVNLEIPSGLSVAIVGESGVGKTTLLRILAGLVEPTCGKVAIGGGRPADLYGSTKLAFLYQEANLWLHLTVRQNLELVYKINDIAINHEHISAQIRTVGLQNAENLWPHQLSAGMKARAAIARALCLPPKVLLMDEPFAALDPARRSDLNTEIRKRCRSLHATSVWVTHDVVESLVFSDMVIALPRSGSVRTFDTRALPHVEDTGALPAPVRNIRDEILTLISGAESGLRRSITVAPQ